jgi:hypothetical protein
VCVVRSKQESEVTYLCICWYIINNLLFTVHGMNTKVLNWIFKSRAVTIPITTETEREGQTHCDFVRKAVTAFISHIYIYIYIYMCVCVCVGMCIFKYVFVCMYVCIYVCMYV